MKLKVPSFCGSCKFETNPIKNPIESEKDKRTLPRINIETTITPKTQHKTRPV